MRIKLRERLCFQRRKYRRRWKDWRYYPIRTETGYLSCSMCSLWNHSCGDRSLHFRFRWRWLLPISDGTSHYCGPKRHPKCLVRCCTTVRRPRDRQAPSVRWTNDRIQDRRRSCTSWLHLAAVLSKINKNSNSNRSSKHIAVLLYGGGAVTSQFSNNSKLGFQI